MIQISKQKTPFKATLNQLQRGNWDGNLPLSSSRRNGSSRSPASEVRDDLWEQERFSIQLTSQEDIRLK